MGMIFEAVADDAFPAHWQARAAQIAQGPTQSYRRIKAALAQSAQNGLEAQMLLEGQLQGEIGKTRDAKEGILAFGQKRPPAFEGR